jgi:1-deoxy-D-xylulose-5-phosphate synthase
MAVLAPADENDCRQLLTTAFEHTGPTAVRYPRGSGAGVSIQKDLTPVPWGKGELRRQTSIAKTETARPRIAILAFGTLLYPALEAAEKMDATVANMRFIKPMDTDLLLQLARDHDGLVTLEEGCVMGGAGSAVLEALQVAGVACPVLTLGLPDEFIEHGDPAKLLSLCGLDAAGIEQAVIKRFGGKPALVRAAVNQ